MRRKPRRIGRFVLLALLGLGAVWAFVGRSRRANGTPSGKDVSAWVQTCCPRLAAQMESVVGDTLIVLRDGRRIRFREVTALVAAETLLIMEPAFRELDLRFPGMAIVRGEGVRR